MIRDTTDSQNDALLLDIPGAARLLAVSDSTVRRLVAAGHLEAVRVFSAVRVRRADVERLARGEAVPRG